MRRSLTIPATLLTAALTAAGTTTAPATGPTTSPGPPIARWLDQLGDPDPAVRDDAREQLMGLPAAALPALLDLVRAQRPVRPAQAAALPEIVRQAFLADEPYDTDPDADPPRYILGQSWPRGLRRARWARLGVPVVNRWPGFPAGRWLRDGDLILGLYADPHGPADRPPDVVTHTVDELEEAMRTAAGRPTVTFAVLRNGRAVRVTLTMVAEPARTADRRPVVVAAFLAERRKRADDYWAATFAPAVNGTSTAPRGPPP